MPSRATKPRNLQLLRMLFLVFFGRPKVLMIGSRNADYLSTEHRHPTSNEMCTGPVSDPV